MRIAVLHPSYEGSSSVFKELEPECDPARYLPEHDCVNFRIVKATAARQVSELARMGFDVAINLCDGAWDEDRAGIEVVQALEKLGMAFTGAGSNFYDPSREAMKMACHSAGVGFPAYATDVEHALRSLCFPMIVKHPHSYSSIGLTPHSRVTTPDDLSAEVARTTNECGGALIEEFIEGREFTVLVAEARHPHEEAWALAPVEFVFPPGESFKHFDLKWKEYERMETRTVEEPLATRLREASALMFAALGGTGYGRVDLRVDAAGDIYALEINPYCGVFYPEGQFGSADFILAADPAGHRGFLDHLIACALRRRDRARRLWDLRYDRTAGFGMFANRDICSGEIVERYEERAHYLVSRRQVDRTWHGLRRKWFGQYCWPMSANVHVMWSDNPDEWRPMNHSCDPNTHLNGLDVVACRDIPRGEQITIDYATFCGPEMEPFDCRCGAINCRGLVGHRP